MTLLLREGGYYKNATSRVYGPMKKGDKPNGTAEGWQFHCDTPNNPGYQTGFMSNGHYWTNMIDVHHDLTEECEFDGSELKNKHLTFTTTQETIDAIKLVIRYVDEGIVGGGVSDGPSTGLQVIRMQRDINSMNELFKALEHLRGKI